MATKVIMRVYSTLPPRRGKSKIEKAKIKTRKTANAAINPAATRLIKELIGRYSRAFRSDHPAFAEVNLLWRIERRRRNFTTGPSPTGPPVLHQRDQRRIYGPSPCSIASPITHVASLAQSTAPHPRRRASPEHGSKSSLDLQIKLFEYCRRPNPLATPPEHAPSSRGQTKQVLPPPRCSSFTLSIEWSFSHVASLAHSMVSAPT